MPSEAQQPDLTATQAQLFTVWRGGCNDVSQPVGYMKQGCMQLPGSSPGHTMHLHECG